MSVEYIEVGRVCVSKAGRDKGRFFVIVEVIDEQFVHLADGQLRKLANPKKKKIKHIACKPELILPIKEKISGDVRIFDSEISKALSNLGYDNAARMKEG